MNRALFLKTILTFMKEMNLFPCSRRAHLAISGGMDSMVLLEVMSNFKKQGLFKELQVLHFNHGTRGNENDHEVDLVRKRSFELGLKFAVGRMQDFKVKNFENEARKERYKFLREHLEQGDYLYTAHHIDDSLEWSLMSQFKSSSYWSALGIPLKNGQIARPFLCLSKNHIRSWVKDNKINYLDDSSNLKSSYERNYLRLEIIPQIKKRFPSYLSHYVYRSNDLAQKLGVFVNKRANSVISFENPPGVVVFYHQGWISDFSYIEEEIINALKSLSKKGRGVLREQIRKMILCKNKWGPLVFSGNVKGYMMPGLLALTSSEGEERVNDLDSSFQIDNVFLNEKEWDYLEFKDFFEKRADRIFPFWVLSKELEKCSKIIPSIKRTHPLWKQMTSKLVEKNIWFRSSIELLRNWQKSSNIKKRLKLIIP